MSDAGQFDTTPQLDLSTARGWLDLLHGTSPGWISIVSTADWKGRFFDLETESLGACDYITHLDRMGAEGIYVRTTTVKEPTHRGRGGEEDSYYLPGFAGDIDIAGPGHKHDPAKFGGLMLPPDVPTAQAIVREANLPEPTLWVHSGGGLYPWWLLDNPVDLTGPDGDGARQLAQDIQTILVRQAKKMGWHYGALPDMSRVLRIPGTINRKAGREIAADIIEPPGYEFFSLKLLYDRALSCLAALPEEKVVIPARPVVARPDGELRPGDDFELRTPWEDILIPHFDPVLVRGGTWYWRRAGSTSKWSATTGRGAKDRLFVFSTETGLPEQTPLTKFAVYTYLEHGGDFKAATKELVRQGFGSSRQVGGGGNLAGIVEKVAAEVAPRPAVVVEPVVSAELVESSPSRADDVVSIVDGGHALLVPAGKPRTLDPMSMGYGAHLTDTGNAKRFQDMYGHRFRWDAQRKCWMVWDNIRWIEDDDNLIKEAAVYVANSVIQDGANLALTDEREGKKVMKFGEACLGQRKLMDLISAFRTQRGISVLNSFFDAKPDLVTVANTTLRLRPDGSVLPIAPAQTDYLTRLVPVDYDVNAKAPKFEKFMADLLPDADLRQYMQRAVGYALSGKVNSRAIFLLYGPPKTGKSQFLNLMGRMFGDFGTTAASDTLRLTQSGSTNNLHGLRRKRFVSTSETSVGTVLDEELIKRVTGGDHLTTRDLYEKNQTWKPECTIMVATNALPQLTVEDSAIWTRVKPVPFFTQFSPTGQHKEIFDIADVLFDEEAPGILNWILAGYKAFCEEGLGEPTAITASIAQHKQESDVVASFIADALDESILNESEGGRISAATLYSIYTNWSARQGLRSPVGIKKFKNRLEALDGGKYKRVKNSTWFWEGLTMGAAGIGGSM